MNKSTNMIPKQNYPNDAQYACKNCKYAGRLYKQDCKAKPCNHCKSSHHVQKDGTVIHTASMKQIYKPN